MNRIAVGRLVHTPEQLASQRTARPAERKLKQLIWLYFWLLLFEGALRKWVLPSLSTPLLIIRDPVALGIIWMYITNGYRFWNLFTLLVVCSSLVSFVTTIGAGHGNFLVALFGIRIYAIHFPLIFIIGEVFDREDVEKIGHAIMYLIIPVTILVVLQFYSPQSAWVNRGVGDDLSGAGFSGALGFFRPSGLFSFTNGNTLLYGLAAAYMFYFWRNPRRFSKAVLFVATAAIFITIPLSISRSYAFQMVICFLFVAFASISDVKSTFRFMGILILLPLLIFTVAQVDFVATGIDAMSQRFENASQSEGGIEGTLVDRFLGGLINPIFNPTKGPLFGYGLGMGTNAGSMMLTGEVSYLISEGETGRVIGEQGKFIGLINIISRLTLGLIMVLISIKTLFRGNALPWMLLSFSFLGMITGLWGQPTSLGFSVFAMGLTLAAVRNPISKLVTKHVPR
jgi:hypothetical protein